MNGIKDLMPLYIMFYVPFIALLHINLELSYNLLWHYRAKQGQHAIKPRM